MERTDPWKLLEAARRWTSIPSRTIPRFDVDAFQAQHGLADFSVSGSATANEIVGVLNHPRFRKGKEADLLDPAGDALRKLDRVLRVGAPVEIVLPSFAGRPHNPAAHRRVSPDLGELYALQLLKNILDAVKHVYPPGLLFTLILDGRAYRPFYGYSDDEAMTYGADLEKLIGLLGARGQIRTVDLQDLIAARSSELEAMDTEARHAVRTLWDSPSFAARSDLVRALRQGTNTVAISSALSELYKSGRWSHVDLAAFFAEAEDITRERAEHTAFEYAVLMTKLKAADVIGSAFWGALRGTVHPKPSQYSPRIADPATTISPWHGVGIARQDGRIITEYEAVVYQDFEKYRAVFVAGDDAPFYYEEM
ncbi:L-tyrosine/L-tryptophan isonitrile synthase family protein [Leifsonia sp. SIMBA_070]|uniref:L-tyrosine/L-tryptophan isonitrile synthase family protein n=1 Tax=Leifsonia sp. SIMBA_070 TaxID=3085810 RepID=UPI00397D5C75